MIKWKTYLDASYPSHVMLSQGKNNVVIRTEGDVFKVSLVESRNNVSLFKSYYKQENMVAVQYWEIWIQKSGNEFLLLSVAHDYRKKIFYVEEKKIYSYPSHVIDTTHFLNTEEMRIVAKASNIIKKEMMKEPDLRLQLLFEDVFEKYDFN